MVSRGESGDVAGVSDEQSGDERADPVDVGEPSSGDSHGDVEAAPRRLQLFLQPSYLPHILTSRSGGQISM